jgi:DNA invertase Pin-like site-specific DNA recombinase
MGTKAAAYIRVSTDKQDVDNQRLEILELVNQKGLGTVTFTDETVSGRKTWRDRKLGGLLDDLTRGDALVVAELSRLGRSMLEIMEILSVSTQKGIKVYAAKGDWALDGSLQSKVVAMCFAMAAEIERDLISQRTRAALQTRKARGLPLGRPTGPGRSKLDKSRDRIIEDLKQGFKRYVVAQRYGTTPANLRNWLAKHGLSEVGKGGAGA